MKALVPPDVCQSRPAPCRRRAGDDHCRDGRRARRLRRIDCCDRALDRIRESQGLVSRKHRGAQLVRIRSAGQGRRRSKEAYGGRSRGRRAPSRRGRDLSHRGTSDRPETDPYREGTCFAAVAGLFQSIWSAPIASPSALQAKGKAVSTATSTFERPNPCRSYRLAAMRRCMEPKQRRLGPGLSRAFSAPE